MTEPLYCVALTGILTGEYDESEALTRFRKIFRLDADKAKLLLRGKERVIKKNLVEAQAMELMIKVMDAGLECYVQEIVDENVPAFNEKRRNSERRMRYRRPPCAGAIVPDRRVTIQRTADVRYFRELVKSNHELPLPFESYPRSLAASA